MSSQEVSGPNVRNLIKKFSKTDLEKTLDETPSDLGASHNRQFRNESLSLKKRERKYQDLRSIFETGSQKTTPVSSESHQDSDRG